LGLGIEKFKITLDCLMWVIVVVVLLLDGLLSHRVGCVGSYFGAGVFVWFLFRYFSDLNSIELLWSKMKSVLRRLKAWSWDDLRVALKTALGAVTL
jgi:transposase